MVPYRYYLLDRLDMEETALKEYSTLSRALELEPLYTITGPKKGTK